MSGYGVRGGSGGLTVEYQELKAAASRLRALAQDLEDRRRSVGAQAGLMRFGAVPLHAAAAREVAAAGLEAASGSLDRAGEHLRETAEKVEHAVESYLEAEGRLQVAGAVPKVSFAAALWSLPGSALDGRALETLIGSPISAWAAGHVVTMLGSEAKVAVLHPTGTTVAVTGAASFLAERSRRLQEEESGDVFEILVQETPEGKTFIVTLPGTQSEGDVFGTAGLGEATADGSAGTAALIADALRKAGASPDDAVVLNGYSQGGIHAANAAAPLVQEGFNVRYVMTSGAPTGHIDTPPGVIVFHIEHGQDLVPALDGTPNPDTPDRTTMGLSNPAAVPDGEDKGLGPGHRLENYEEGARLAESAPEQSLRDSMAELRTILGTAAGAGGTAAVIRVKVENAPAPQPGRPDPRTSRRPGQSPVPVPPSRPLLPVPEMPPILPVPQMPPLLPVPVVPVVPPFPERGAPDGPERPEPSDARRSPRSGGWTRH